MRQRRAPRARLIRTLEAPQEARSRTERVSHFHYPQRQVLLTWRNEQVHYLEDFWQHFYPCSAVVLWHRLLDRGVETFFSHIERLHERLEDLEEEALRRDGADFPRLILEARRGVVGRVYEGLDAARDELSNVLDVTLASQNNRLNLVVQRLTMLSAIFLPAHALDGHLRHQRQTIGL